MGKESRNSGVVLATIRKSPRKVRNDTFTTHISDSERVNYHITVGIVSKVVVNTLDFNQFDTQ